MGAAGAPIATYIAMCCGTLYYTSCIVIFMHDECPNRMDNHIKLVDEISSVYCGATYSTVGLLWVWLVIM